MASTSSRGMSTGGQTYSMIRFHSRRCSDGRPVRASRMASQHATSSPSTSGRATARPSSSRTGVRSRTSATATSRSSLGFSRPTQSKRWTSPAAGSAADLEVLQPPHLHPPGDHRVQPAELDVLLERRRVGPAPSPAIQYGRTPSSPGRRNVSTSVAPSASAPTTATRRTLPGRSAASSAAASSADKASPSRARRAARTGRRRRCRAARRTPPSPGDAPSASARPPSPARAANTWTARSWRS